LTASKIRKKTKTKTSRPNWCFSFFTTNKRGRRANFRRRWSEPSFTFNSQNQNRRRDGKNFIDNITMVQRSMRISVVPNGIFYGPIHGRKMASFKAMGGAAVG